MCFGSSNVTQRTIPNPPSPEEQEAQRLALQGMELRSGMLPYMVRPFGYELAFDDQGKPTLKPIGPSAQQQAVNRVQDVSLAGADQAGNMLLDRLKASQGMIPGLLRAVQATQPQYRTPTAPPQMGSAPGGDFQGQLPSGISPQDLMQRLMTLFQSQMGPR